MVFYCKTNEETQNSEEEDNCDHEGGGRLLTAYSVMYCSKL